MSVTVEPIWEEVVEARARLVQSRPITFDEFLALFGAKDDVELIDGVAQKRMAAQLDHEKLYAFLFVLLTQYAQNTGCGIVLGSRTAVQINQYRGRLPDLLFVRQENADKIGQKGLLFAPDLVIEIVSPGDRPSDLIPLEADYRTIGVREIVFVDQIQQEVRVFRKVAGGVPAYDDETFVSGDSIRLDTVNHVTLRVDWLLHEPRPTIQMALAQIEDPARTA